MTIRALEKEVLEPPPKSRARFTAGRVNQLIQEAMDSGPETTLTKKDFDAVFKRVLKKAAK